MQAMGMTIPDKQAVLADSVDLKNQDLTHFLQVSVKQEDGKLIAYPIPGGGSGDLVNLRQVTGFLEIPPGTSPAQKGAVFPFISFRA
jgi:molybdopterin molybdotransferase